MELRGNKLFFIEGGNFFINPIEVWSMLLLDNDHILIATQHNGLFVYDGYNIFKFESEIEDFLIKSQVFSSLKLSNGNLLFGTIQNGIVISNQNGDIIQHINKEKGLQNNTILSMLIDNCKQLWLGLDNGISYIEINSAFSHINDGCGIEGTGYCTKLYNGYLYLGTNQGLYCKKWSSNKIENSKYSSFKLINNTKGQVWSLSVLGGELICGHNKGTFIIKNDRAKLISDEAGGWMFIETQIPDKIIGGTFTSLISFEKDNFSSWTFKKKYENFHESCRILASDSLNNIWISHEYKGVIKLDFAKNYDEINSFKLYNSKNGFHSDFDIFVYKFDNDLIFCSDSGIYMYNYQTDKFYKSLKYDNIFGKHSKIRIPKTDKKGNIWFYKNNKLVVQKRQIDGSYIPNEKLFFRFEKNFNQGFENIEFIDTTYAIIGTDNGFVQYNITDTFKNNKDVRVIINSVKLTKPTDSIISYGFISDVEKKTNQALLSYDMNAIKFSFVLPYYDGIERTEYKYQLEGFDKFWSKWKIINEKEYTNLSPGEYTFKVKAKNIFNHVSKVSYYQFRILPPWYKTIWAYLLYLLLSVLSVAVATRFLIGRIQLEKRKLEKKQQQELKEKWKNKTNRCYSCTFCTYER